MGGILLANGMFELQILSKCLLHISATCTSIVVCECLIFMKKKIEYFAAI